MTKSVAAALKQAGFHVDSGYIYNGNQPIGTVEYANRRAVTPAKVIGHYCKLCETLYGALDRFRQSIEGDRAE